MTPSNAPSVIEIVFNLCSLFRCGLAGSPAALRAAMQKRLGSGAQSDLRLSFWVRICQSAALLDSSPSPYPTLLMEEWLCWPDQQKAGHLLAAWVTAPLQLQNQKLRKDMLDRLQNGIELSPAQRFQLSGLQALGFGEPGLALPERLKLEPQGGPPAGLWKIDQGRLIIPSPPDWRLVWDLEKYLEPEDPGIYPLDARALQQAAQRGALDGTPNLAETLARGLGQEPPVEVLRLIQQAPTIRVLPGVVLEFSHPKVLLKLRQGAAMRRDLAHLLSSRHVLLDDVHAERILRRLVDQGLLSTRDLPTGGQFPAAPKQSRAGVSPSDQAYLLRLAWFARGMGWPADLPPGLLERLTQGAPQTLVRAAVRQAEAALLKCRPPAPPEAKPAPRPAEALIQRIQKAIDLEESIQVLYQGSAAHSPEPRCLTPLLIETRGTRVYLIAYCHTRRANRTFRLDRLQWPDDD